MPHSWPWGQRSGLTAPWVIHRARLLTVPRTVLQTHPTASLLPTFVHMMPSPWKVLFFSLPPRQLSASGSLAHIPYPSEENHHYPQTTTWPH